MDSAGEWIIASEVSLAQPWRGTEKLGRMLASVIQESLDVDSAISIENTPVIVCFAERGRPGRIEGLNDRVLAIAQSQLGFNLHPSSMSLSQGRVGIGVALREARRLLYEQREQAVIIAGVDSYLSAKTLMGFEQKNRLLTEENSDGFIPGEAASAVIARKPKASATRQLIVAGLGFGVERATIESDSPLRADGLRESDKELIDRSKGGSI